MNITHDTNDVMIYNKYLIKGPAPFDLAQWKYYTISNQIKHAGCTNRCYSIWTQEMHIIFDTNDVMASRIWLHPTRDVAAPFKGGDTCLLASVAIHRSNTDRPLTWVTKKVYAPPCPASQMCIECSVRQSWGLLWSLLFIVCVSLQTGWGVQPVNALF